MLSHFDLSHFHVDHSATVREYKYANEWTTKEWLKWMEKGLVEANEKCEFAIKIYSPLQTQDSKPQRNAKVTWTLVGVGKKASTANKSFIIVLIWFDGRVSKQSDCENSRMFAVYSRVGNWELLDDIKVMEKNERAFIKTCSSFRLCREIPWNIWGQMMSAKKTHFYWKIYTKFIFCY